MNHLLNFAILGIVLMGCEPVKPLPTIERAGYNIIIIDSCEYVEVSVNPGWNSATYSLTHKGNCKNPIHKP